MEELPELIISTFITVRHPIKNGVRAECHLLKRNRLYKNYFRHSGADRTKARCALNAQRAARRVSEANNPGNEAIDGDSWIPAFAGLTVVLA
jgi:hypothetical protein